MSFQAVFQEAKSAAQKAFSEAKATPVIWGSPSTPFGNDVDFSQPWSVGVMSGFAWVHIYEDGRKAKGKEIKAAGIKRDDYAGAFYISSYDLGCGGQSMELKSAGCQAAAEVFQKYGYRAYAGERLD